MTITLDVVVTCTDRKSAPPDASMQARNLTSGRSGDLDISEWRRRLQAAAGSAVPARNLYQGETWSAALELEEAARAARGRNNVRLWVLSAGYGLIQADAPVAPYGATFTASSPDFVGGAAAGAEGTERAQRWWQALCRSAAEPFALRDLARSVAGDLLLVLSEAYLRACRPDVTQAVAANERALVLTPAAGQSLRIQHAAPPFDARLLTTAEDRRRGTARPIARGTRMSLNVRVARLLVERFEEGPIDRAAAHRYLNELTEAQEPLQRYEGATKDDLEVRRFLAEALRSSPGATKSRLLREFRDGGNSCEQKRFGRLFDDVAAEHETKESA